MRSVLLSVGLSLVLAVAFVFVTGPGPRGPALRAPFANLHDGYPRGLPAYGGAPGVSGVSDGGFEGTETTNDLPGAVLDFYRRSIDPALWTITSAGSRWLLFSYAPDPAIRGAVDAVVYDQRTRVTVWLMDLRTPSGFPTDFPAGHRARTLDVPTRDGDTFVLRWDVNGNASTAGFIDEFAQILAQAGWEILTRDTSIAQRRQLTCRSRSQPELGCSVTLTFEDIHAPGFTYQTVVATVRVGGQP